METLILRDERFLAHDPGPGHPESAPRLEAIHRDLDARPVPGTRTGEPAPAERAWVEAVHAPEYVSAIEATAGRERMRLDWDTATSARSYEVALLASGAAVQAARETVEGRARGAFALVRPPGHHAESRAAMGFCLFNQAAVAAEFALRELGCRRVLLLDPDVHHGNGTQHAFWERDDVLYVSSHRYPFYPGTGGIAETGAGAGEGFTLNLPLPAGMGDAEFHYLYGEVVGRVAREYAPDLILVSAGYDTWQHDPLGGMRITGEGFAALFGLFAAWAEELCPGRLACTLEGGYDPAGNVAGVRAALEQMAGAAPRPAGVDAPASEVAREVAELVAKRLGRQWPSLKDLIGPGRAERGSVSGPCA